MRYLEEVERRLRELEAKIAELEAPKTAPEPSPMKRKK
jgi:hypothetical protein